MSTGRGVSQGSQGAAQTVGRRVYSKVMWLAAGAGKPVINLRIHTRSELRGDGGGGRGPRIVSFFFLIIFQASFQAFKLFEVPACPSVRLRY